VWYTDVPDFSYRGKFLYLATVIDVCTREIVDVNLLR
jgi:transposase InsO family protein